MNDCIALEDTLDDGLECEGVLRHPAFVRITYLDVVKLFSVVRNLDNIQDLFGVTVFL